MRPGVRLHINGAEADPKLTARLLSLTINDEAGIKSDTCEIELNAGPGQDASNGIAAPPIGTEIRVWLGYEPTPAHRGSFRVVSWERSGPPSILRVTAVAAELTGRFREPKMRSHHETTVGDIVRKIAREHGLAALVDAAIGARQIEHIDQRTESDMSFLSRLAKRQGATFKVGDGKILFAAPGSRKLPGGEAKPTIVIEPQGVSHWTGSTNDRGAYTSAKCAYIDHGAGKRLYATAGTGSPCHTDKRLYGSKAEAEAAAQAALGELTRSRVSFEFEGPGNPALFAEAVLDVRGFSPDVDGAFYARSVRHSYSGSGYTTSATLETEGGEGEG